MLSPLEQFEIGIFYSFFIDFYFFIIDVSFSNLSLFLFLNLVLYFSFRFFIFKNLNEKVFSNPLQNFMEKIVSFILSLLKDNLN